ncbi:hypothetical protein OU415_05490 [Saccharopolyspora sp. WRP15-2]|uniref:DUF3291 domain-containing protein n=1 Tax=Saccharopolyspora oryzae TaxID=2997343 RepID=A0ABT4UT41_9PSEU|nr:hypothetical protein [Saccharopolyspora oryzae]MDA3624880.1 hypothetical protein [Saccharopolyspora oryzae]
MTDIWFARWKSGPARASAAGGDPVVVSVTEFTPRRPWTALGVCVRGTALRRIWPDLEGAVGVWLWLELGQLHPRAGAVSVWRGEADLRRFVGRRDHVQIMRAYRDRGAMRSTTWLADRFDPPAVRKAARDWISGT